jgi:hypothetical protein
MIKKFKLWFNYWFNSDPELEEQVKHWGKVYKIKK